ncbi:MAG: WXG100 family type VII secretion target [Mobiluncus porci]|uniref:WXG100 family type VII secretion target n=1 Tax=Mobiluncus TaxID=2050 RepID=UPI0023F4A625|nr:MULTISPECIES: WXG100 family type VII secretion target [Mobiluncus]MCI6585459.1 WXG100 family type VII secretion target [Mobiluncus sp.]MDD7541332.1 WXG100 family type VII secretion target [Mobiluncus porci]MDY5747815.1 WXG100 family type VII secretion target [Mobiluncus porci]
MQFQVDSEAVALAASQTRACAEAVSAQVSAMMANLVNLQSTWTGNASGAFESLAQQWRATQATVEDNLRQIGLQLDTASQTYAQAETTAASLFATA